MQPQTAETWAVGFNATPVSGLRFGGEFYSIDAKNTLGSLNRSNLATYVTNADLYTYSVTPTQYAAILAGLTNGAQLGTQQVSSDIGIVVDTRTSNLNAARLEGFDFNASYQTDTGFGRLAFGINGTRQTKAFLTSGGVAADQLGVGSPKLSASTFVGLNSGPFSAKVTVNYSGKFRDQATNNLGLVETVDPFVLPM